MRLHASPSLLALSVAPLVVNSLQLPFGITLPAALDSRLASIKSAVQQIQVPSFINKIIDPTGSSPLLSLHRDLVAIPSVTGDEEKVAKFLEKYLTGKGFKVELIPVESPEYPNKKRYNVFAYPEGGAKDAPILLTSHIDTVPPFLPFKDGLRTVYGRGSCDAKASVASQIIAVEELLTQKHITEDLVSLLFVVGEETTGDGMRHMNSLDMKWEAVIFGEPTELKMAVGHKGLAMLEIEAKGKASHSGYPSLGINANSHIINALYKLDHLDLPSSDLLGNTTLNIGLMNGGVAANVIPAFASAEVAIRIGAKTFQEVKDIVDNALKDIEGVEATWKKPYYDPVICDHDIEGFETIATSYGTDIPNLNGKHKKYLYGPGSILVAHGDNEKIDKSDLYEAVKGYKRIVKGILSAKAVVVHDPAKEESIAASAASAAASAASVQAVVESEKIIQVKVDVHDVPANKAESKGDGEEKVEYVTILPVDSV
ncbi:Aminoacylase-1 [Dactylellina cionopaga]|nr:Aminoacylase-1 [Dactylellina cionopaga]